MCTVIASGVKQSVVLIFADVLDRHVASRLAMTV
jgi:hypothetical protein